VNIFNKQVFLLVCLSVILSACASLPDQKSIESRAASASLGNNSVNDILQKAKLKLKKSNSEELSFYAPSYHNQALEFFATANSLYAKDPKDKEAKLNAQLVIEYLNAGSRNKKMVKDILKKSLKTRKVLIQLKADKNFSEQFNTLEQKQITVIKTIEQQDAEGAKNAEKNLLKEMRMLEVHAIDYTYLGQAYTMLKQANELNAKDLMPKTRHETLQNLAATQEFIRQNPRQELRIEELAQLSLYKAERLYSLTRHAHQINTSQDNKQLESFILHQEEQLDRINKAFDQVRINNLSFNDQSIVLQKHAEQAKTDIHSYKSKSSKVSKTQLDKWKRKTVLLQAEVRRLQKALKKAQAGN
jgi:hypothetical protein